MSRDKHGMLSDEPQPESAQCVQKLYGILSDHVRNNLVSVPEALAILKTFHEVVLREIVLKSEMLPTVRVRVLTGYLNLLLEDVKKIESLIAKEIQ